MNISQLDLYCKLNNKRVVVKNGKQCGYNLDVNRVLEDIDWENAEVYLE